MAFLPNALLTRLPAFRQNRTPLSIAAKFLATRKAILPARME